MSSFWYKYCETVSYSTLYRTVVAEDISHFKFCFPFVHFFVGSSWLTNNSYKGERPEGKCINQSGLVQSSQSDVIEKEQQALLVLGMPFLLLNNNNDDSIGHSSSKSSIALDECSSSRNGSSGSVGCSVTTCICSSRRTATVIPSLPSHSRCICCPESNIAWCSGTSIAIPFVESRSCVSFTQLTLFLKLVRTKIWSPNCLAWNQGPFG